MKVLVVEDDPKICAYLQKGLEEAGHNVECCRNGKDGLIRATSGPQDVIVLDRMLPELDGLALLQTLRATGSKLPVLILSAMGEVEDRVRGLREGGDDYLVKPFAFSELLARLEILVDRKNGGTTRDLVLKCDDLEMDLVTKKVQRRGRVLDLQSKEFDLLEFLMRHKGKIVTRTMLLEHVWNYHFDPQTNLIDVHISRLRKKIDQGESKKLLQTIRGSGYSMKDSEN